MAQGHKTLASVFHNEAETYTKVVAGYTVPVRAAFKEGDTLTALQARALSAYVLERAASVANSNIDRGSWKDMSDAEKVAKATAYLGGEYKLSDDIGSVFGISILNDAATKIVAELAGDKVKGMEEKALREALAPHVARFLNDPSIVEKYEGKVRDTIATILAERHEKRTRTAKADTFALEVAF